MMSVINISDVCEMISKNSFEGVKEKCESIGICVKEKSVSENDLYLLANANANENKVKNNIKNIISLLPTHVSDALSHYESDGKITFSGQIKGKYGKQDAPGLRVKLLNKFPCIKE